MKKIVTIAYTADRYIENLIYTTNMILAQNYENFELIFSIDQSTGISIGEIISILNFHTNPNIKNIKINFNKEKLGLKGNIKKIHEQAQGEYILILQNEEAFYTPESLSIIINEFYEETDLVVASSCIFNEIGKEFLRIDYYGAICYKKETLGYFIANDIFDIKEIYRTTQMEKKISECKEVCYINKEYLKVEEINFNQNHYSENEIHSKKLNRSNYIKLKNIEISQIDKEIEYIVGKQRGGSWKITDSDLVYIYYLEKLKEINSGFFLYKKIRKRKLLLKAKKNTEEKIKLVFFAMESSVWPSFESVYMEAKQDKRFDAKIVHIPYKHVNKSQKDLEKEIVEYKNEGYEISSHDNYNLSTDSPDVVFFIKPYDGVPKAFYIDDVDKVVRRSVYIPYGMEVGDADYSIRLQTKQPLHFLARFIVAYSPTIIERAEKFGYGNAQNYLKIGHPRFDLNNLKSDEKSSKKTILWNTHFTIDTDQGRGSYLDWGEIILEILNNFPDLVLVWRPHPLFYEQLSKYKGIPIDEINKMFEELELRENIVIDRTPSYLPNLIKSDALISDSSSLVPEYLASGKPILYTPKITGKGFNNPYLQNILYTVKSKQNIIDFFEMVSKGMDYMKNVRIQELNKHIYLPKNKTVAKELLDVIYLDIEGVN